MPQFESSKPKPKLEEEPKAASDMTNIAELRDRIEELEAENATLQEQLASS